jgi:predicted MPP superfamily phosphohydrolase
MLPFLLVIFIVYGALHLYAFLRLRSAFGFGTAPGAVLALLMVFMILAPVTVRLLEGQGFDLPARLVSLAGYSWMGLLFLFFCLSVLADILRFAASVLARLLRVKAAPLRVRSSVLLCLILATALFAWGYASALDIGPRRIVLASPKVPQELGRIRIVQVSDVHVGLMVRSGRLRRIARVIREANPDLLVSTGDLVDGQLDRISGLADILRESSPRYGKFAVTGNHEFYAGLSPALDFTSRCGFTVLRGESVTVEGVITIAGFDDPAGFRHGGLPGPAEKELLRALPRDTFTLVLKHQPLVPPDCPGLFDLQLSGHTHGGQIFPFGLLVSLFFPHTSGMHDLGNGSSLYVSRGTGTWGPPARLFAPPEVTVIDVLSSGTIKDAHLPDNASARVTGGSDRPALPPVQVRSSSP